MLTFVVDVRMNSDLVPLSRTLMILECVKVPDGRNFQLRGQHPHADRRWRSLALLYHTRV